MRFSSVSKFQSVRHLFIIFRLFFFLRQGLCCSGWPQIRGSPQASVSQVVGLEVHITMPYLFLANFYLSYIYISSILRSFSSSGSLILDSLSHLSATPFSWCSSHHHALSSACGAPVHSNQCSHWHVFQFADLSPQSSPLLNASNELILGILLHSRIFITLFLHSNSLFEFSISPNTLLNFFEIRIC